MEVETAYNNFIVNFANTWGSLKALTSTCNKEETDYFKMKVLRIIAEKYLGNISKENIVNDISLVLDYETRLYCFSKYLKPDEGFYMTVWYPELTHDELIFISKHFTYLLQFYNCSEDILLFGAKSAPNLVIKFPNISDHIKTQCYINKPSLITFNEEYHLIKPVLESILIFSTSDIEVAWQIKKNNEKVLECEAESLPSNNEVSPIQTKLNVIEKVKKIVNNDVTVNNTIIDHSKDNPNDSLNDSLNDHPNDSLNDSLNDHLNDNHTDNYLCEIDFSTEMIILCKTNKSKDRKI